MRRPAHLSLVLVTACSGGGDPPTTPDPPDPPGPAPVHTVALSRSNMTLVPGETATITGTTRDAQGNTLTGRTIQWSSASSAVATVNQNGVVVGVAPGATTITASAEGKSAAAQVTVDAGAFIGAEGGTVASIDGRASVVIPAGALSSTLPIRIRPVDPPTTHAKLVPGTSYEFTPHGATFLVPATLRMTYTTPLPQGLLVGGLRIHRHTGQDWTLVPGGSVNAPERVVSVPTNTFSTNAIIDASVPVVSVTLEPTSLQLEVGEKRTIVATPRNAQGNAINRVVTWSSTAAQVATVSNTGEVTAVAPGSAIVRATSEGITADASVTVTPVEDTRLPAANGFDVGGLGHACAIRDSGALYCWGRNSNGQLGTGDVQPRMIPTAVATSQTFRQVVVGFHHTCALALDGQVFCWGANQHGQLANGSVSDPLFVQPTPLPIVSALRFIDISAEETSVCGVTTANAVYCWGLEQSGMDFVDRVPRSSPTAIAVPENVVSVATGALHSCALTADGRVYCWGDRRGLGFTALAFQPPTLLSTAQRFVRIVAWGTGGNCGVTAAFQAWCWGSALEIGEGTGMNRTTPVRIGGTTRRYKAVGVRCLTTTTNESYCWGTNTRGAVGDGTTTPRPVPTRVTGGPFAQASSSEIATCGVSPNGLLQCWGDNTSGTVGNGIAVVSTEPTRITGAPNTSVAVTTSGSSTCVRTNTGVLHCWGVINGAATPAVFPGLSGVTALSMSTGTYCVLPQDGHPRCWGENGFGSVGDGTTTFRATPTAIADQAVYSAVSTGGDMTCGIVSNGVVKCWGFATGIALQSTPTAINGLPTGMVEIETGHRRACARHSGGTIWCWGPTTPQTLQGSWSAMFGAGYNAGLQGHQCALANTVAWCVGLNDQGQLGDGSTVSSPQTFRQVSGGHQFASLSPTFNATCGLATNGAVFCWGLRQLTPAALPGGHVFTQFDFAGTGCGVKASGQTWCWGSNENGRLGTGEPWFHATPGTVSGGGMYRVFGP